MRFARSTADVTSHNKSKSPVFMIGLLFCLQIRVSAYCGVKALYRTGAAIQSYSLLTVVLVCLAGIFSVLGIFDVFGILCIFGVVRIVRFGPPK